MDENKCSLRLEDQLCFPLYAYSKEIVRRYKPHLDAIGLTYTQYITMMVLWERGKISEKEIGKMLYLDSGTLTPVIKKLEAKGLVTRTRNKTDERFLEIAITKKGEELKEAAAPIPGKVAACIGLDPADAATLCGIVRKQLAALGRE